MLAIRKHIEQRGLAVQLVPRWRCSTFRGSPSGILLLILEAFGNVYIVLDALDECSERKDLQKWIKEMTSWKKGKLH